MKLFLQVVSVFLSLVILPVAVGGVKGRDTKEKPITVKKTKDEPAKTTTLYTVFIDTVPNQKVYTGRSFIYKNYDGNGTLGTTKGLSGVVGNWYLIVTVYNFEDANKPNFTSVNDNKLTFTFDDGSLLVANGLYDGGTKAGAGGFLAVSGGTGKYAGATGQLLGKLTKDGGAVEFTYTF